MVANYRAMLIEEPGNASDTDRAEFTRANGNVVPG
jgi:hypothetical protein